VVFTSAVHLVAWLDDEVEGGILHLTNITLPDANAQIYYCPDFWIDDIEGNITWHISKTIELFH
jgi:hypothetical protein